MQMNYSGLADLIKKGSNAMDRCHSFLVREDLILLALFKLAGRGGVFLENVSCENFLLCEYITEHWGPKCPIHIYHQICSFPLHCSPPHVCFVTCMCAAHLEIRS